MSIEAIAAVDVDLSLTRVTSSSKKNLSPTSMSASHEVGAHRHKEGGEDGRKEVSVRSLSTETTPLAAGTTPLAAGTTPLAAGESIYDGLLVPKRYQLQPPLPERPPRAIHPDQIPLWDAPATNSLPALIVSTTSGSHLASGPDRDTMYALCTLARHAVERFPAVADDVELVRPQFDRQGYITGGIVVATAAAAHAIIGRDNDPGGRDVTEKGIERLANTYSVPEGSELRDPLIALHGPIRPRSKTERFLRRHPAIHQSATIQTPRNHRSDPYWFVFQPGIYLWENILEGEQGWWVSAGAYRRLAEGRGLWLWLKGQSQVPAVRNGAPIEIRLGLLHDKLGLHSRDAAVARRSIERAANDIYSNVPGFLRGTPIFGHGGRGMSGKVRFYLDPTSDHIASREGKNKRLVNDAARRRQAIEAGEIDCRADDLVRMFLEVTGRNWDSIGDPIIQLRHAKLLLEDNFDYDEARLAVQAFAEHEWWGDKDFDLNTVRQHWGAVKGSGWYTARAAA